MKVPVLLAPLASLVQHADLDRVAQIHLPISVGHFPDVVPFEKAPATSVSLSYRHPQFSVLFFFKACDHH